MHMSREIDSVGRFGLVVEPMEYILSETQWIDENCIYNQKPNPPEPRVAPFDICLRLLPAKYSLLDVFITLS